MAVEIRDVIYCPYCGWESFDPDSYEQPCSQSDCDGVMTGIYREDYEI